MIELNTGVKQSWKQKDLDVIQKCHQSISTLLYIVCTIICPGLLSRYFSGLDYYDVKLFFSLLFPVVIPIINEIKLPSTVPVFRGYPEVLVCEAEGNPKPTISWAANDIAYSETLTISESTPEIVNCTANNTVGWTTIQVKVVLKGNYGFLHMFWFQFPTAFFVVVGGGSTL